MIKIALAGNPNSGKTTLFNHLSGQRERVGNYAGVTVEVAHSKLKRSYSVEKDVLLFDLPGTYGIDAFTDDERAALDVINHFAIDLVINVIDSTQLERSLRFTLELLKSNIPIVVALNKHDLTRTQHIDIDLEALTQALKVPVIFTEGLNGKGLDELMQLALKLYPRSHHNA
jgi:ferrous iron transport protein B